MTIDRSYRVSNIQRERHRKNIGNNTKWFLSMTLAVIMAAYFFYPFYWLFISSMKSASTLYGTQPFLPSEHISIWTNFMILSSFHKGIFWRWFLNSLLYSGVIGICGTIISAMAAYVNAKFQFRFRKAIQSIVVGGLAIPYTAFVVPLFLMDRDLGIMNTYIGVILPQLASPFGVFFLSQYIREAIPIELIEAARVDGYGEYYILYKILLPLIIPGLITLFIIIFVASWNNYNIPLVVLTSDKLYSLTVGLSAMGGGSIDIIGSLVSIIPSIVLFLVLRRYIISGIIIGAITD